MTIAIVGADAGETITVGPVSIRILEDGTRTTQRLGLVEVIIPPGIPGPPQHVHREHDETFYVLSGTPTFTCGTDVIVAGPGTLVTAPPGTPHTFANPGEETARLLCTVTPDRYIDYFREVGRLPVGPNGPDPSAMAEIMARYATEVVGPRPA